MNRVLRIIGQIDSDSFSVFCEELSQLEKESKKPVTIELCSEGGDTYVGLAFYGRIKKSPCRINVLAYGYVMSAATIILVAGHARTMQSEAWFMVHDDKDMLRVRENNKQAANTEYDHAERIEQQWARILARHTAKSPEFWREASRKTTYLSALDCVRLGLVEKLV